jgi:hypothetical protein
MTVTQATQNWLALEHEAVWVYPIIGARFTGLAASARTSYAAHVRVRDVLLARLHSVDVTPVAAKIAYDVGALETPRQAQTVARRLEQTVAASCLTLAGVGTGAERTFATQGLRRAALAELAWGGRPTAFPGLP